MQRFKPLFADPTHRGTLANIQTCLRLNDLDEVGDPTHYLTFQMLGLFSFRSLSLQGAIDFWFEFLDRIGLPPSYVTIHPDKLAAWSPLYRGKVDIRPDPECLWSDGSTEAQYSTEFYRDGVEIGNIVHPFDTCIDCGFGLERIASLIEGSRPPSRRAILEDAVLTIIQSGYRPGPTKQGYVLRKLLRILRDDGGLPDHPLMREEIARHQRAQDRYEILLRKNPDRSPEWWWDTHGIEVDDVIRNK